MDTYTLVIEAIEKHDFRRLSLSDVNNALQNNWINEEQAEMIAGIILDC